MLQRVILGIASISILILSMSICEFNAWSNEYRIIFERGNDTWISNFDGKKQKRIIENSISPSCSRIGDIAFVRNFNIWVDYYDRKEISPLTDFDPKEEKEIRSLAWSPDGKWIIFCRDDKYRLDITSEKNSIVWPENEVEPRHNEITLSCIFLCNIRERNVKKFIGFTGMGSGTIGTLLSQVEAPTWSPTGDLVAFSRNGDIWIAKIKPLTDKREKRLVAVGHLENENGSTPSSYGVNYLTWSPDGEKIIFSIGRMYGSGMGGIGIVSQDGTNFKMISSKGYESNPMILPNNRILFSDGYNIRTMNLDGTNEQEIIHEGTNACICNMPEIKE